MKARSVLLRCATVSAALFALATPAFADEFMNACIAGGGTGTDMSKTCTCISGKIPGDVRADATVALRRSTKSMQDSATPLDPSTLPPNLMRGLQAYVLAQADCM
jgi:hypothetical protein